MIARRLALASLLCFATMAPTPGSVGACGGDDLSQPAELEPYCEQSEQLVCVRRYLRKEITADERDACRLAAVDRCAQRSFPSDCHPTERETQTCLNALASFDTLQTKESKLPECNTHALCGSAPPPAATDDVDDAGAEP